MKFKKLRNIHVCNVISDIPIFSLQTCASCLAWSVSSLDRTNPSKILATGLYYAVFAYHVTVFQKLFLLPSPEVVSDFNYKSHVSCCPSCVLLLYGTLSYLSYLPCNLSHATAVQTGEPQFSRGQKG